MPPYAQWLKVASQGELCSTMPRSSSAAEFGVICWVLLGNLLGGNPTTWGIFWGSPFVVNPRNSCAKKVRLKFGHLGAAISDTKLDRIEAIQASGGFRRSGYPFGGGGGSLSGHSILFLEKTGTPIFGFGMPIWLFVFGPSQPDCMRARTCEPSC